MPGDEYEIAKIFSKINFKKSPQNGKIERKMYLYISALKSQRDFEILKIRLGKMGDEHLYKKISIN